MIGLVTKNKKYSFKSLCGNFASSVDGWVFFFVLFFKCTVCCAISQFHGSDTILWVCFLGGAGGVFLFPPVGLHVWLRKRAVIQPLMGYTLLHLEDYEALREPDWSYMWYANWILMTFIPQSRKWTCVIANDWLNIVPGWKGCHPECFSFALPLGWMEIVIM